MEAATTTDTTPNIVHEIDPYSISPRRVLVIGSGPSGVRACEEILKREPNAAVTLFGDEPYAPYNRVLLSSLLAGDSSYSDIISPLPEATVYPGFSHRMANIVEIDSPSKQVRDHLGQTYDYDQLIIATGSRPHIPNIPGTDQDGVYTFRDLRETQTLYGRIARARHVVVIGGGLLGLEAARAMLRANTKVTLVQQSERLMNRQLDDSAAALLREKVEALGINVITESGVRKVLGQGRVEGVVTRSGEEISCDTVLICAGIKPNVTLAQQAKLKFTQGILVDDQLLTSTPSIYAIGECCEHRCRTYGLVAPGLEQASIAAAAICRNETQDNRPTPQYIGSTEVSRLKVVGEEVCSMGQVVDLIDRPRQREITFSAKRKDGEPCYRKLVLNKGEVIGAVGLGPWPETRRIQEAYQHQRVLNPLQQLRFQLTGSIWGGNSDNINNWPESVVVCQCSHITKGELDEAIAEGHNTVVALQTKTSAATTCGSCKPLLEQLVGHDGPREKEWGWMTLLLTSLIATVLAAAVVFIPGLQVADSVQTQPAFERFWNDGFWKQVSGFTLLGLSVIGLLMSLRKRLSPQSKWAQRLGKFAGWRLFHVTLGVTCALTLLAHTGFHLGSNLNRWLMIDFLTIITLGAVSGLTISLSHTLAANHTQKLRSFWAWAHILVTWPLPLLLGLHILTVYYF